MDVLLVSGGTQVQRYDFPNSDFEPSLFHASDALCTPSNATTCRNVVMGFGKDLATGWGKAKETIGCRKLKKNEKGVLKSYTPLTSSHDDFAQNKNYTYGHKADGVDCSKYSKVAGSLQSSSFNSIM
jgi:hypothetical protein